MSDVRLQSLDALRGFALLGVILVNASTINGPFWMLSADYAFQASSLDTWITDFSFTVLVGKFYPMFVFLFGVSNCLLLEKIKVSSLQANAIYIKRMVWLAIFGLLHIALFFWGDVLFMYAILGIILLLFSDSEPKTLLKIALGVIALTAILPILFSDMAFALPTDEYQDLMIIPYQTGSLVEIVDQRLADYYEWYLWGFFQTENIYYFFEYIIDYLEFFALMALGMAVGKMKGYLVSYDNLRNKVPKIMIVSIVGIAIINAIYFFLQKIFVGVDLIFLDSVERLFFCSLYIVIFYFFYEHMGENLKKAFASVGRMTLTWYLLSSLLMSLILHGYGLGLYGKIGPAMTSLIAVLFLIVIFLISTTWLNHFKQGPMEKVWRKLSYPA